MLTLLIAEGDGSRFSMDKVSSDIDCSDDIAGCRASRVIAFPGISARAVLPPTVNVVSLTFAHGILTLGMFLGLSPSSIPACRL